MSARKCIATATGRIAFGGFVLVRGARVSAAAPDVANARALPAPFGPSRGSHRKGASVQCELLDGLGNRSLQAIADGPIMDSNRIYLPAGRLTEAEYRDRTAEDLRRVSEQSV